MSVIIVRLSFWNCLVILIGIMFVLFEEMMIVELLVEILKLCKIWLVRLDWFLRNIVCCWLFVLVIWVWKVNDNLMIGWNLGKLLYCGYIFLIMMWLCLVLKRWIICFFRMDCVKIFVIFLIVDCCCWMFFMIFRYWLRYWLYGELFLVVFVILFVFCLWIIYYLLEEFV